ncbi:MAG: hypothetical protein WBM99_07530, partial [Psychromonas sp.]
MAEPIIAVVDGLDLPENFHVPAMTNIGAGFDLNNTSKAESEYSALSQPVVSANHTLVQAIGELPMHSDNKLILGVPTNIVTGFLGVGKTSAILNLLK